MRLRQVVRTWLYSPCLREHSSMLMFCSRARERSWLSERSWIRITRLCGQNERAQYELSVRSPHTHAHTRTHTQTRTPRSLIHSRTLLLRTNGHQRKHTRKDRALTHAHPHQQVQHHAHPTRTPTLTRTDRLSCCACLGFTQRSCCPVRSLLHPFTRTHTHAHTHPACLHTPMRTHKHTHTD